MSNLAVPVAAYIVIKLQVDGQLVVESNCHDAQFAKQMIDQALDAIKGHHERTKIVVPDTDSDLDDLAKAENTARGAISAKPRLLS